MVKSYFYVFGSEGNTVEGEISGVPGECDGTIFMGFCKPNIRSEVKKNDWIIGISNAKIKPRKILSLIEVKSKPKLYKAEKEYPEAIWSKDNKNGQIYIKSYRDNGDIKYKYIEGCPHSEKHRNNDMLKYPNTDVLIVGSDNSIILGNEGYVIDNDILSIMKRDKNLQTKEIDDKAPFGRDSAGRCQGRPRPAIVELKNKDIDLLKKLVNNCDKQVKIGNELCCGGC